MHKTRDVLHETTKWLRLAGGGAYSAPQGKDFPPHQHRTWELVYYREGNIECPIGEEVYEARPGTLLITPPHTVHSERARTAYANYYFTVDAPAWYPWPRICHDDAERTCGAVCAALVRECTRVASRREEMLTVLLAQLDIIVARMQEERGLGEAERLVIQAEQVLEERYAGPVAIHEVAREIGASPSTLRSHFARYRGISPLDHLHEVRRRHAVALIRTSTLTLEAIAGMCGYDSASHLSRHIKRATGQSPGSLREERTGKDR